MDDKANLAIISVNKDCRRQMFRSFVESTYDNSIYWPVYGKTVPDYAPLEFFVEKAKKQGDYEFGKPFVAFTSASAMDYHEVLKSEPKLCQIFPNEILTKQNAPEDWDLSLKYYIERVTELRNKTKDYDKPIYIIAFDLEKQKNIINVDLNWREYEALFNGLGTVNIHLVYVTGDASNFLYKGFIGHALAARIGDESKYDPIFKKIPANCCKYVNLLDKAKSTLYKPITYSTPEFWL